MGRANTAFAAIAAALVLLVAINVLAAGTLRGARLDLTEDGRFTLSQGTRNLLAGLEERVSLEFYASRRALADFPPLADHARRVEEMLGEYVRASGDRLRLTVLDPLPFSEAEDEAVAAGVRGVPGPRRDSLIYLGLVGRGPGGDVVALPFLHPDEAAFLEYELSRLVQRLSRPEKPEIGLLTGIPMRAEEPANPFGRQRGPQNWIVLDTLNETYRLRDLDAAELEAVPADLEVLLVVHPHELPERALYALDQFVLRGGRLLAFVDPWCHHYEPPEDPNDGFGGLFADRSSDLGPLLEAWGVRMEANQVVGDADHAQQVQFQGRSGRVEVGRYLPRLVLGRDAMNREETITRDLGRVVLWYAGALEPVEGSAVEFTPLLSTGPRSTLIGHDKLRFGSDPAALLADFVSLERPLTLAARLSGPAESAFPDGPPEGAPQGEHLEAARGPIQVVLVGDVDFLADRAWAQRFDLGGQSLYSPTADNGGFVLNALDVLVGGSDLISLRGRRGVQRPFERVDEMRRAAEERFRAEEQRLVQEEERVGQRIDELISQAGGSGVVLLPPEVQEEIAALREQRGETRKRLREVRHSLDRDVDALGTRLKWLHVGALPSLVFVLAGIAAAAARRRRPQRQSVA